MQSKRRPCFTTPSPALSAVAARVPSGWDDARVPLPRLLGRGRDVRGEWRGVSARRPGRLGDREPAAMLGRNPGAARDQRTECVRRDRAGFQRLRRDPRPRTRRAAPAAARPPAAMGCRTRAGRFRIGPRRGLRDARRHASRGTAYTVHSSKGQRRTGAGDAWTDVPGTARTGQLCPYEPAEPGEYRAVAEITVGDERGLFASSDVLTVDGGPPPCRHRSPGWRSSPTIRECSS